MATHRTANPSRTRDAEATRGRILEAVGKLLVREGFGALGVNAVAREAGTDKVLIYRYFGGMEGLVEAWARDTDFWPTVAEVLGTAPEQEPARLAAGLLKRHVQALRKRPHTLAILAWETALDHPLNTILAKVREERAAELLTALPPGFRDPKVDFGAIAAILGAGLQYLLLRSRTVDVFSGVPIASEEGWQRLEDALDTLCSALLSRSDR